MQREWHQNGAQTRVTLACLCASYLLALLPLYGELNLLVYLVSLLAIGWRSGNLLRRWPLPSRRLLNSLALLRHPSHPVVVVLLNNDGGGIFSLLPAAAAQPEHDACFPCRTGWTSNMRRRNSISAIRHPPP